MFSVAILFVLLFPLIASNVPNGTLSDQAADPEPEDLASSRKARLDLPATPKRALYGRRRKRQQAAVAEAYAPPSGGYFASDQQQEALSQGVVFQQGGVVQWGVGLPPGIDVCNVRACRELTVVLGFKGHYTIIAWTISLQ